MDVKRRMGKESGGRKSIDRQSEKRRGTDGEQGRGPHRREDGGNREDRQGGDPKDDAEQGQGGGARQVGQEKEGERK